MWVAGWLLVGETSPLHKYFIGNPEFPNLWRLLNMPNYLLAAWVGGNVHQPSLLLLAIFSAVQWGFVGVLMSLGLSKVQTTAKSQ